MEHKCAVKKIVAVYARQQNKHTVVVIYSQVQISTYLFSNTVNYIKPNTGMLNTFSMTQTFSPR